MRVFISWSGDRSKEFASALHDWIPSVLQSVSTYMSSHDIEKGERWLSSVFKSLEDIEFGVVVLTLENLDAPWIQFESGALSKNLERSRLVPVLCGVTDADLSKNPLSTFQYVKNDKEGLRELVEAINANLPEPVASEKIRKTFDLWWSELSGKTSKIDFSKRKQRAKADQGAEAGVEARIERLETSIDEILYSVRGLRHNRDARASLAAEYEAARDALLELKARKRLLESRLSKATDNDTKPSKFMAEKSIKELEEVVERISIFENRIEGLARQIEAPARWS